MKKAIFTQNICTNCLQKLVNDEGDHSASELKTMHETLSLWAVANYVPAGMHTDKDGNCEPFFSWRVCDLCNGLAGDRYEYDFFQTYPE